MPEKRVGGAFVIFTQEKEQGELMLCAFLINASVAAAAACCSYPFASSLSTLLFLSSDPHISTKSLSLSQQSRSGYLLVVLIVNKERKWQWVV